MKKFIFLGVISGLIASCSTSKQIVKTTESKSPIINQNSNGMLSKPLLADLAVETSRKEVVYKANLRISDEDKKSNAMQLFLETHSCDYIVDPIYSFTRTDEGGRTKDVQIKLTGLPAKYTKITQVDSLPKSIQQYQSLVDPVKRTNYVNSIEESDPIRGLEFYAGTAGQRGLQVDFLLKNEMMRGYISAETYSKFDEESVNLDMDFVKDGDTLELNASGLASNYSSISAGVMKEFPVFNRLKLRGQAGLNYGNYGDLTIAGAYGTINNVARVGFRLGLGLDYKIYKNISFVLKAHSNINAFNIYTKEPNGNISFKVKNFEAKTTPLYFIGYGIRIIF